MTSPGSSLNGRHWWSYGVVPALFKDIRALPALTAFVDVVLSSESLGYPALTPFFLSLPFLSLLHLLFVFPHFPALLF